MSDLIFVHKTDFSIPPSNEEFLIIISTYNGDRIFKLPNGNLCKITHGYIIKDESGIGDLIILTDSLDKIDNKISKIINNNGSLTIIWTGIQWNII